MRLGEMLDLLIEEYFKLGAAEAEIYPNEWLISQHSGNIVSIRSALEDFYTPEQMVKVEAMIDERVEAFFS
jgi:hypothetical protein